MADDKDVQLMRTIAQNGECADATLVSVAELPKTEVMPLRVLHVVPHIGMGGTELAMLNLLRTLNDASLRHSICAVRSCDPGISSLAVVEQIFDASNARKGFDLALPRLLSVMKKYRPHIVHSRNWGAIEAIPAARFARIPIVVHSEHGYELDNISGLPIRRRLLRRLAYGMADVVFTVTEQLRDYHCRQAWIAPDRIRVMYNGVDTNRFGPNARARFAIREQLGIRPEAFVFGSVGRVVAIKDHRTILRAGENLQRRGISFHILLVGSGPELGGLQNYVNQSPELRGRVHFAGATQDVPDWLNAMDVFVLPSIAEGMSNTLLEAMASALPVLATPVGGNTEVLSDECGWLFTPGDADVLASKLQLLAGDSDLRQQVGYAARLRAVRLFGLQRMAENYRKLYFDLANRHDARSLGTISHVRD